MNNLKSFAALYTEQEIFKSLFHRILEVIKIS